MSKQPRRLAALRATSFMAALAAASIAIGLPAPASSILVPRYSVTPLGQRHATSINNAGQVVGTFIPRDDNLNRLPNCIFSYDSQGPRAGNVTEYGFDPAAKHRFASDDGTPWSLWDVAQVNDTGTIVGSIEVGNPTDGRLRAIQIKNGEFTNLGQSGPTPGRALAINNSGVIVGTARNGGEEFPAVYADGQIRPLDPLGGNGTANAINDVGQIAGISYRTNHAFTSSGGANPDFHDLGTLGGTWSRAHAINNQGHVVGSSEVTPGSYESRAFLYKDGTMTNLGALGMDNGVLDSTAWDINDLGDIVGSSTFSDSAGWPWVAGVGQHAFLYTGGTLFDLNELIDRDSPWIMTGALGINNLGQIIASAVDLDTGEQTSLLLTPETMPPPPAPIPEPGTAVILALAIAALAARRVIRRRQAQP